MRTWIVATLVACALGIPASRAADQGLRTDSAGVEFKRAAPQVFLSDGEGFVPTSGQAGLEWTGRLFILRAGQHRFFVTGGTLRIDSVVVGSQPVRLETGYRDFRLTSPAPEGKSLVSVEWEGPGFLREPIPARFLSHEPGGTSQLDGRALFEDMGCSNCHLSESHSLQQRPGPVLTGLGARRKLPWILHWLDSPRAFREWGTMPDMLTARERADVAAFLAAQQADPLDEPRIRGSHIERGRTTFQVFGCVACHGSELSLAGLGSKMTAGRLQQYLLAPIRYSPDGRMPSFHLDENEALELAAHLVESRNEAFERPSRTGDAQRGRELVASSGCLACHRMDGLQNSASAPSLGDLVETRGCLSRSVPDGLPRYRLLPEQRSALRWFVGSYRDSPDRVAAPTFDLARRLFQLRCNACHDLNGRAPTGALAEPAPSLTGVGAKLRASWIERVIGSETRTLDWQELRMPSYGAGHASWLADALAKASGFDPTQPEVNEFRGERRQGLHILGVDGSQGGMGCIGCHGWREFPPLGENGPNLYHAGQRLRASWFRRWMRDPERIVAGTSMPSYFGGQETPESIATIEDLWAAFRSAPDLPPPFGFRTADAAIGSEATPVPRDRAIVIRWDMPESSPASFAVGLPGGVSFCFDAGQSRLRYAWQGGFVDMTRTLFKKKNPATNLTETAEIDGEIFFREGPFPIRVGERDRIPQRRFRGYRLVDSVPEFHYQVDGVEVFELIDRLEDGLIRRFRISNVNQPMWFVPTEAEGYAIRSTLDDFTIPRGDSVAFEVTIVRQR